MENEIRRFVIGPRRFQDRSILPRFARIISHSNYALPLSALSIRACHTRLRMAFHCQLRSIIHHFRLVLSRYILSDNIRADNILSSIRSCSQIVDTALQQLSLSSYVKSVNLLYVDTRFVQETIGSCYRINIILQKILPLQI